MNLIRVIDVIASLVGLIILAPFILIIVVALFIDHQKPFFIQMRVGRNQSQFRLVKFRSMSPNATDRPTHEISADLITRTGKFIRATKLDELPQLWNVLKGEMSLVGPRPCLPSQKELINARERRGVFKIRPGITGPAQIRNIDMSSPEKLAKVDEELVRSGVTMKTYLKLIGLTVLGRGQGDTIGNSK